MNGLEKLREESKEFSQGGYIANPSSPKPAGVVSSGYCIDTQTGEVRDSIDDFLEDVGMNKENG